MIKLKDVLSLLYADEHQQVAFVKCLIYAEYTKSQPLFSSDLLNDVFIIEYLNHTFPTLEQAYAWLLQKSEQFLRRPSFAAEGVSKEKNAENGKRWDGYISMPPYLQKPLQDLSLTQSFPWPDDVNNAAIVLFSNLEFLLAPRIKSIPKKPDYYIYLLSGPRGLFNAEPSLPYILADWFGKPELVAIIKAVLEKYQNYDHPYQWHDQLANLKQEILKAIGEEIWPVFPQSFYWQDQAIYDAHSKIQGSDGLACLGGAWPVAADLAAWLLKKHLGEKAHIVIQPVIALGKAHRLTGILDELELFFDRYVKQVLSQPLIFVACNTANVLNYIKFILLNNPNYRELLVKQNLLEKIQRFLNTQQKNLRNEWLSIVGPGDESPNQIAVLDSLAKLVDAAHPWLLHMAEQAWIHRHCIPQTPEFFTAQIVFYYKRKWYLQSVEHALNLILVLSNAFQIQGLFNFIINILNKKYFDIYKSIIAALEQSTIKVIKDYYFNQANNHINFPSRFDHIEILSEIRNKLEINYKSKNQSIEERNLNCYELMKQFFNMLFTKSATLFDCSLDDFVVASLGSYSRKNPAPFSDIEFFVILKNQDVLKKVKHVLKLVLLFVLNLGETVIPNLRIAFQNKKGDWIELSIFDTTTTQGVSFDRGEKTPLDSETKGKITPGMIGDAEYLVKEFLCKGIDKGELYPQLMLSSEFMFGNLELYKGYLSVLEKSGFDKYSYALFLLQKEIQRLEPFVNKHLDVITEKTFYYRPVIFLIDILYLIIGNKSRDMGEKIDALYLHRLINSDQKNILKTCLKIGLEVRLSQQWEHGEQKTYIPASHVSFERVQESRGYMGQMFCFFNERFHKQVSSDLQRENGLIVAYNEAVKLEEGYQLK